MSQPNVYRQLWREAALSTGSKSRKSRRSGCGSRTDQVFLTYSARVFQATPVLSLTCMQSCMCVCAFLWGSYAALWVFIWFSAPPSHCPSELKLSSRLRWLDAMLLKSWDLESSHVVRRFRKINEPLHIQLALLSRQSKTPYPIPSRSPLIRILRCQTWYCRGH